MKLAFCLFKFFPYGGLQRDFLRIAEVCRARGHEVHVFTSSWQGQFDLDATLHLIKISGWQNHQLNQSFADQIYNELKREHFDLVIGFNKMPHLDIYYAADICYQAKAHGILYRLLPRYRQQVRFEKAVFGNVNTEILLISPYQQQAFIHYYQTQKDRMHLLPPGIARDRVAPVNALEHRQRMRVSLQLTNEEYLLLLVGSGFKTKGLDRAIRALASLPANIKKRTRLYVIGQDNPVPFKRLAKKLKVTQHIEFLGGRSDVADFLLAADCLIHPAYHENAGTVLLEALASGLPVLTTDVCGYAHYIKQADAGKVISSPFEQSKLNNELLEMLCSPQRSQWQQNGITFAKSADIYSLPEKAADFIEQLGQKKRELEVHNTAPVQQNNLTTWYMHEDIQVHFADSANLFDQMMSLRGEYFRSQNGRLTQRIKIGETYYFIKQHIGVGWKEILKNLLVLRLPVFSAKPEWLAIQKLKELEVAVPTLYAYGERGKNPAKRQSFVLMEELVDTLSLENISQSKLNFTLKRRLIAEIAHIAAKLHQNGINHRDFYLCHFLLKVSPDSSIDVKHLRLYLIDLHRMQMRHLTPRRWIIKDLAGLYFSSKRLSLTKRDYWRFIRIYQQKSLREIMTLEGTLWEKVRKRGEQLYRTHTE